MRRAEDGRCRQCKHHRPASIYWTFSEGVESLTVAMCAHCAMRLARGLLQDVERSEEEEQTFVLFPDITAGSE